MYNYNNRQFLFKLSSGNVLNMYHDEKAGLCYSTLNRRNVWTDPISIQKNIHPPFFTDIGSDDSIHILYQDKQGNIFYSHLCNQSIKTTPVLNSRNPSTYNKHMQLVPYKNSIHIFFIINHNNSSILAHQTVDNGSVGVPKVIDYVEKSERPYSLLLDNVGNIYIFYQASDGKHLQIGYKKYSLSQKTWGEFIPVTRHSRNCEFPNTIIDPENIISLCYQRRTERQFELVYQQKVPEKNLWSQEKVIHTSPYSFDASSIMHINGSLIIYWVREEVIFYSMSKDGGLTWSKPSRYYFVAGRQLMCISYKTNHTSENDKIIAHCMPGNFINGYKLAFYQEPPTKSESPLLDELKTIVDDKLGEVSSSLDKLRESYADMKDTITSVKRIQQNMERELIKYSLKLTTLENEFRRMKAEPVNREKIVRSPVEENKPVVHTFPDTARKNEEKKPNNPKDNDEADAEAVAYHSYNNSENFEF